MILYNTLSLHLLPTGNRHMDLICFLPLAHISNIKLLINYSIKSTLLKISNFKSRFSDSDTHPFTILVIIKLIKIQFRCGSGAAPGKLKLCSYFNCFAIFKNIVHSLKPRETPSYSASYQALNYVQRF